jgi:uncharacterized membrane protein YesL
MIMSETEANVLRLPSEIRTADILSRAFDIYSRNFLSYFLPFLVMGVLSTLLSYSIDPVGYFQALTDFTVGGVFSIIIGFLLSNVANGLVIKFTSEIMTKGKGDLGSSFNHAIQRIISLLIGSIIFAFVVGLGLVMLIVPGVILFIVFCLVNQFIILEDKGPIVAFSSSRRFVSKNWTKVFLLSLLLILIIFITAFASDIFYGFLGDLGAQILTQVVSSIVQPLWPISFTILYYRLKEERTGEEQPF